MGRIFRLKTRSRAVLSENDQRSVIPIPANALVVIVGGDVDQDVFVTIRYEGRLLLMFSEGLRSDGERWRQSA